jgi:hypothetical protein
VTPVRLVSGFPSEPDRTPLKLTRVGTAGLEEVAADWPETMLTAMQMKNRSE